MFVIIAIENYQILNIKAIDAFISIVADDVLNNSNSILRNILIRNGSYNYFKE